MNKNTIIGFVVIGVIMFGFSWYQSKERQEQLAAQQEKILQEQIDNQEELLLASADSLLSPIDTNSIEETVKPEPQAQTEVKVMVEQEPVVPFKDSLLNQAYDKKTYTTSHVTISNDLVEIEFTPKGAQPYSVKINNYTAYNPADPKNPTDLYFIRKGFSEYSVNFELSPALASANNMLQTKDFKFEVTDTSATHVVMQLPFENGYIQQKYWLEEGDYMLKNELTVVGFDKLVADPSKSLNTKWNLWIPRLEKGFTNEMRYSKVDYHLPGEDDPEEIAEGSNEYAAVTSTMDWFALQQQFFSAIMTPKDGFSSGEFDIQYFSEESYEKDGYLMDCRVSLSTPVKDASDTLTSSCEFYFGPNDYKTLKAYDREYERIIPLGGWMVSWFNRWVIIPVFDFLGKYIGNYGIIILILTLLIKLLLLPLTIKSYKSTAKMQVLRPEIQKLNEKYPKQEDAMKKQQAMMNLYQKAGVSPMGGCLPMLLQMPILFAMFRFFPSSIELRQQSFLWADDLSAYDSIIEFNFPLLGNHISLFALLMALSMFFYSKMNSAQNDGGMPGMKFMSLYLMPIMMFFICNSLSSALSYYYLLSNLITMLVTWYIRKFVVTEAKVRDDMAKAALKPRKKSKWQMRLEEAQRMQEQMQKDKKNRR